jgi:NRAMP (natural resistance-associated macrophage protein)-like metal ion transporter
VRRRSGLVALAAVVGPGLLAGLSDDDPAGITTYSILGTEYGYALLWVLALSTLALVLFHELGARLGIVTGQGLAGLIRERYGVRWAGVALLALVIANLGTTCAEFAGVAAALDDSFRDAPVFYVTYGAIVAIAAGIVLLPGAPLVPILVLTQALNAILLPPLLIFMAPWRATPHSWAATAPAA